jgi:predicted nucleic acid-binding protein
MAMLIDSDVLIWLTRGHVGAQSRLGIIHPWRISVVTYLELAQGCRSKDELQQLKRGLAQKDTEVLPLTSAISERAIKLIDTYALSGGLQLADALIAATALEYSLTVLTANAKHFAIIDGLNMERFVP